MDERKFFTFYRSYYEIALELPERERLEYLMAIIQYQFTGEEPELKNGITRLAFLSQKHSMKRQIEGYLAARRNRKSAADGDASKLNEKDADKQQQYDGGSLEQIKRQVLSDELFVEQVMMTFRDVGITEADNISAAFEKCYMYHMNGTSRPRTIGEWKQKLISWLGNEKPKPAKKSRRNPGKI